MTPDNKKEYDKAIAKIAIFNNSLKILLLKTIDAEHKDIAALEFGIEFLETKLTEESQKIKELTRYGSV